MNWKVTSSCVISRLGFAGSAMSLRISFVNAQGRGHSMPILRASNPEGIPAISRGFREATPPEYGATDDRLRRGRSDGFRLSRCARSPTRLRPLQGRFIFDFTGGIAALNHRLMALTPLG